MGCKHYDPLAAASESRETPESLRLSEMPCVVGDAGRHESRRTRLVQPEVQHPFGSRTDRARSTRAGNIRGTDDFVEDASAK